MRDESYKEEYEESFELEGFIDVENLEIEEEQKKVQLDERRKGTVTDVCPRYT